MSSQPISPAKADILIIDDTPENLNLLNAMLTTQGYKVRRVTKGFVGLRGAQAAPPDLILLDVNMPQMNGYEVCQHLKTDDRTREIPVIFISALTDVLDKVRAFSVGGVDYITKPFQVEEVLARIETHLTIRKLQQQLQSQNIQLQQEIRDRTSAEEKFAKAFCYSPNPMAIAILSDGRFIDVNPSFLQMSGYSLEEVIGHRASELNLDKDEAITHILQQLFETGALHNHELELRTQWGELKTILLSVEQIELAGVGCALLIANDITERKRLENEFISLVSHELRTPLTSLMGALDLLGAGKLGTLTQQGQKVLRIATTNTERLIRLVNDILDLERMKSGTVTMNKVKFNAADLLIQATETMQTMAEQAQVKLLTQPLTVELWADCDRLLQTLTNLLSNAIKFSPPGSTVWLTAQRQAQDKIIANKDKQLNSTTVSNNQIPHHLTFPHPTLLICVKDQGRGIPIDKLQLIFEPFQQVDASDSRQKGGTGLGLTICRNIIEQHEGKIWVESVLGQGSSFYIALPLMLTA